MVKGKGETVGLSGQIFDIWAHFYFSLNFLKWCWVNHRLTILLLCGGQWAFIMAIFFAISDIDKSLADCSKSIKKTML